MNGGLLSPWRQQSAIHAWHLTVGRDAGDGLAERERVDLLRALVRQHRLQVVRVPDDRVLESHAVGAEDGPRLAGYLDRRPDIAHLAEADLLGRDRAGLLEPAKVQGEQLRAL